MKSEIPRSSLFLACKGNGYPRVCQLGEGRRPGQLPSAITAQVGFDCSCHGVNLGGKFEGSPMEPV